MQGESLGLLRVLQGGAERFCLSELLSSVVVRSSWHHVGGRIATPCCRVPMVFAIVVDLWRLGFVLLVFGLKPLIQLGFKNYS